MNIKLNIMKKVCRITILLIILGLKVAAQNQTYTQMFDSLLSNVPYSVATTGILLTTYNNWKTDLNIITR